MLIFGEVLEDGRSEGKARHGVSAELVAESVLGWAKNDTEEAKVVLALPNETDVGMFSDVVKKISFTIQLHTLQVITGFV